MNQTRMITAVNSAKTFGSIFLLSALLLAACDSKRPKVVLGTQAERIKIVSKIVASNTPLPSGLLDANFVQEVINDGGSIAPSDVASFGVLRVAPADLPAWRAILAPLEAHNTPAAYAAPKQACPWRLSATEFSGLEFHSPKSLTGRVNGWVGIAPDGRIFMYSFSM